MSESSLKVTEQFFCHDNSCVWHGNGHDNIDVFGLGELLLYNIAYELPEADLYRLDLGTVECF